ncbi:hypothetical protein ACFX2G_028566 [Malus domestica]
MVYLGQTAPDFDGPFYNEHYYSRNFSSSSLSTNKKTFKTPEPHDQRWYSYNCLTGMYTALSKSQKHQCQRIDCMARRQAVQAILTTKWQPKKATGSYDARRTPTIMAELLQAKKAVDHDFETTIEESEKCIKLLLRPGEMNNQAEYEALVIGLGVLHDLRATFH